MISMEDRKLLTDMIKKMERKYKVPLELSIKHYGHNQRLLLNSFESDDRGPFTVNMYHEEHKELNGQYATVDLVRKKIAQLKDMANLPDTCSGCKGPKSGLKLFLNANYSNSYYCTACKNTFPALRYRPIAACEQCASSFRYKEGDEYLHTVVCDGCQNRMWKSFVPNPWSGIYMYIDTGKISKNCGGTISVVTDLGDISFSASLV